MNRRNKVKLVHFVSTAWFVLSAGYIVVLALLQAGKSWWFIASLSGYSALMVLLLINLYLVAIFRGVARSQKKATEHPLTASFYYSLFYNISPFLGAAAGCLSAIGVGGIADYLLLTAAGSLWATFLVWIIVDPVAGLVEMLLPSSREHRQKRLADSKANRKKQRLAIKRLLTKVESEEQLQQERWNKLLQPYADKLAALIADGEATEGDRETEAVDIGAKAWRLGGLNCMRQLHSMTMKKYREKYRDAGSIDYISIWWDGIGSWRSHWFRGEGESILEGKGIPCGQ